MNLSNEACKGSSRPCQPCGSRRGCWNWCRLCKRWDIHQLFLDELLQPDKYSTQSVHPSSEECPPTIKWEKHMMMLCQFDVCKLTLYILPQQ